MRKLTCLLLGSAAALTLTATPALAAVTLDTATGTGFVGKGDVQQPLGLNNAALQNAVDKGLLTWSYEGTQTYAFECEWDTGVKKVTHHVNTKVVERSASAAVTATARKTGQYTGWHITLGSITGGEGAPTDADCGAEGNGMKSVVPGSVRPVGGETAPVLRVEYTVTGQVVELPPTPVVLAS